MTKPRIYTILFAKVYPMYVQKAERKGRTKKEVDTLICWLTGYNETELNKLTESELDMETFINQAPQLNPKRSLIKGMICGYRVEEIEDETTQNLRYLDKIIDELAKGKTKEKIMRED